ncbi:MAG: hypothetical protein E7202_03545 [Selenomonas ruminantium]|jgi:hypothetical protein|nr:hypothetical protein [Selenomonas ruminantium]
MKRIFLLNFLIIMSAFICNTVYAGDMPLSNQSGRQIASLLNSVEIQSKLSRKLGRLSNYSFMKSENGKNVYKAVIDGGTPVNGTFIFEEDMNGRLYDIACIYNINDIGMRDKCMGIIAFYLACAGVDIKTISSLVDNLKFSNKVAGSQVYVPSLGGFLTMAGGLMPELPQNIVMGFSLTSYRFQ